MSPTCTYREGPRELLFDQGNTTDGILFAFMTHLSVSNLYVFERMRRAREGRGRPRGSAQRSDDDSSQEHARNDGDGEDDLRRAVKMETVSLADVLQSVLIHVYNTAVIVQPLAPATAMLLAKHFVQSAVHVSFIDGGGARWIRRR